MLSKLIKISGLAFRLAKPVNDIVYLTNFCLAKPYAINPKPYTRKHTSNQSGAVAIIIAIAIPILIGIAGLALDLGKLFITKTELQNAADACALSAANELNGTSTQFTSAEAAGKLVGNLNKAYFQSSANNISSVTFSDTLNGSYFPSGSAPANSKFVKCTATKSNIANFLTQVLNVMPGVSIAPQQSVAASAVATLAPTLKSCSLLPIGVCNTAVNATTAKGTWIAGIIAPGTASLSGSYRWVDLNGSSGSASAIAALLSGNVCIAPPSPGVNLSASGFKASNRDDFNTRFGLKQGSADGVADYTGFSYNPSATPPVAINTDVYADFISKRASYTAYQGDTASGISLTGGTTIRNSAYLKLNGSSRRIVVAPVVDCSTMILSASSPTYACLLLLHPMKTQGSSGFNMYMEYLGEANKVPACYQTGLAGSATSTGPLVSALVQ